MTARVGINGFGRIGRSVLRILAERSDIEVAVINDLFDNDHLAYLLRYDTVMGPFEKEVRTDADSMTVDGRRIVMTAEKDPSKIPWGKHGVDVVAFVSAFERAHKAELLKARSVYAGSGMDETKLYEELRPTARKVIEQDMRDVAAAHGFSISQACEALIAAAEEIAAEMHLSKMQPAVFEALRAAP